MVLNIRWPLAMQRRTATPTTYRGLATQEPEEGELGELAGQPGGVPSTHLTPSRAGGGVTPSCRLLWQLLLLLPCLVLLYLYTTDPVVEEPPHYQPDTIGFAARHPERFGAAAAAATAAASNLTAAPEPVRKAIVFASFSEQDVSWFPEIPLGWEIYRYVLDDPDPADGLPVPRNQGREAMAYLTYIIDHYDDLADVVVFHHGHRRAWHQVEATPDKLRALNLSALASEGYVNLRCAPEPGCTTDTVIDVAHPADEEWRVQAVMLPKFWDTMFGAASPWDLGAAPAVLAVPCCAQFAVARRAIRARPLDFWRFYRAPLEGDLDDYADVWGAEANSYYVGICYEKLWHMLFGMEATHCPSEDYCRGTLFSDALICNKYTGPYEKSGGWEQIECIQKWQESW